MSTGGGRVGTGTGDAGRTGSFREPDQGYGNPCRGAGEDRAGVGRFGVTVDEFTDVEGIVPGE